MAKTFRYDPDAEDDFDSRESIKQQRKRIKQDRREKAREQERMDGDESNNRKPYDVMATIDDSWSK